MDEIWVVEWDFADNETRRWYIDRDYMFGGQYSKQSADEYCKGLDSVYVTRVRRFVAAPEQKEQA